LKENVNFNYTAYAIWQFTLLGLNDFGSLSKIR